MNAFTIKDLENLSGIKAHTIRIWEQRYSFLKPQRTETNIRYYSNDELKMILNVALLNKYGFKVSHINKMNAMEMEEKVCSLSPGQAQQERVVNQLIQAMVDLDMDVFERVLESYIGSVGLERTITQIIFNFLERIGILWVTNHINPAQEHLVTNIIRQKLIAGIENAPPTIVRDKLIVLFLPENEYHELGLLFIYYLLKRNGIRVLYLGANVPLKDVEFIVQLKKPDALYCHLTSVASNFNFARFLQHMQNRMPDVALTISGPLTQAYKKKVPENITFKRSLSEVVHFIESL